MRTELLRVTNPVWARIVNPEPFIILEQTYRYGDVLLLHPGGLIRILSNEGPRVLAAYHAPHAPHDGIDCPSYALLFDAERDLRLMAEGKLGYVTPLDPPLPTGTSPAPIPPCRILPGQQARVPASREARAFPPPVITMEPRGGAYREEMTEVTTQLPSRRMMLRPGGVLTAMHHQGAHVSVWYAPVGFDGPECVERAWFWMSAAEFIRMELRYQELRALERLELQQIRNIMRTLSL